MASLSSISGLKGAVATVNSFLHEFPFMEPIFQLVAPLLLVIVNSILPGILSLLTRCECPISNATLEVSTFDKLAAFVLIQTFLVSWSLSFPSQPDHLEL